MLLTTEFQTEFNKELGLNITYPQFSEELKSYDSSFVEVKGFFIRYDSGAYILSQHTYDRHLWDDDYSSNQVLYSIQLIISDTIPHDLPIGDEINLRGKFRLNNTDPTMLIYILDEIEFID